MAMFKVVDAKRGHIPLTIGLQGPTGAGKSLSAMLLAYGIQQRAGGGPIVLIDTDNQRGDIYAPPAGAAPDPLNQAGLGHTFAFRHLVFLPPFNPGRYFEALRTALMERPSVVVIDQMTAEWRGKGGMLEMVDESTLRNKLAVWKEPRDQHYQFMQLFEQAPCPVIACMRAEDKVALPKGGGDPVHIGFKPIAETLFPYQLLFNFLVGPDVPGALSMDRKRSHALKTYSGATSLVTEGELASPEVGKRLAAWAAGEQVGAQADAAAPQS